MGNQKLRAKDLVKLGYPKGTVAGLALQIINQYYPYASIKEKMEELTSVLKEPHLFKEIDHWQPILDKLHPKEENPFEKYGQGQEVKLLDAPQSYKVYGEENISESAYQQMDTAMRLPVSNAGALMPDAHHGYGIPVGGVLSTNNCVIPYGVGVDIGCRMALSIFDVKPALMERQQHKFKEMLKNHSRFGKGIFDDPMDDPVLDRPEFREISVVRKLKDKAWRQIGTSGSGNHFVEWGEVEILDPMNEFGLDPGKYLALLTHSGSRGMGAAIAKYYTQVAMHLTRLPKVAQHLAWLDLDTQAGKEYWRAMNLAGDYASACHDHIHRRLAKALGEKPAHTVENHHNFAWKEQDEWGREVIVHRKGATPAGKGVLGIIPGYMVHPGFIVRGKGDPRALNSASHGAGRAMSRAAARQSFTRSYLQKTLSDHGVTLIGGGIDEVPGAYKDIEAVMAMQQGLVEVVGKFLPKIVRMDKG